MSSESTAAATVRQAFADLAANVPAAEVLQALRTVETEGCDDLVLARLKHATGTALNRLGLPGEALPELHEGRRLFADAGAAGEEADVWRSIADVHAWRGDGREAALALLQSIAVGESSGFAPSLAAAGRLNLEIGRPREARALFDRALAMPGGLPDRERRRAELALGKALVADRAHGRARDILANLAADEAAPSRIRYLALLELGRIKARNGDLGAAAESARRAVELFPPAEDTFEDAERHEVEAEIALLRGEAEAARGLIGGVVARFAEDDLAGREVEARLLEAAILDRLGRPDEAERTLSAALRRAGARMLAGSADKVRDRLAQRDSSGLAWLPGAEISVPAPHGSSRFVRRRPLGGGGFGTVSRAYDLETGQEIALKNLQLSTIYDPDVRAKRLDSARREAGLTSRIQHPGIGRVYGIFDDADGETILVREMVEGPTLRELEGAGPRERIAILAQLCQALAAVHAAAIIHRDLKPENVILRDGRTPVLIDFGISTPDDASRMPGSFTAAYAAPEQIGNRPVDIRADIFALATMAFELLLGRLPPRAPEGWYRFGARRGWAASIRAGLSGPLPAAAADALTRSLSPRPSQRLATASDLALELQAAL